jgi:hypothetical protein
MTKPNRKSEKMKRKKHQLQNKNHISVPKQPTAAAAAANKKTRQTRTQLLFFAAKSGSL